MEPIALLKHAPKTARLLENGVDLRPGQTVRVTANEQVPAGRRSDSSGWISRSSVVRVKSGMVPVHFWSHAHF